MYTPDTFVALAREIASLPDDLAIRTILGEVTLVEGMTTRDIMGLFEGAPGGWSPEVMALAMPYLDEFRNAPPNKQGLTVATAFCSYPGTPYGVYNLNEWIDLGATGAVRNSRPNNNSTSRMTFSSDAAPTLVAGAWGGDTAFNLSGYGNNGTVDVQKTENYSILVTAKLPTDAVGALLNTGAGRLYLGQDSDEFAGSHMFYLSDGSSVGYCAFKEKYSFWSWKSAILVVGAGPTCPRSLYAIDHGQPDLVIKSPDIVAHAATGVIVTGPDDDCPNYLDQLVVWNVALTEDEVFGALLAAARWRHTWHGNGEV